MLPVRDILDDVLTAGAEDLSKSFEGKEKRFIQSHLGFSVNCLAELITAEILEEINCTHLAVEVNLTAGKEHLVKFLCSRSDSVVFDEPLSCELPSIQKFPVLTSSIAKCLTPNELGHALIIMPDNYMLWNIKREIMIGAKSNHQKTKNKLWSLKELLFTSLLLSCFHKLECIWNYRKLVIKYIIEKNCSEDTSGFVSQLLCYDFDILIRAADNHPMNYNAWNYRRSIICYSSRVSFYSAEIVQQEVNSVLNFLIFHNGDRSACCYLIFLLQEVISARLESQITFFWKKMMSFTQIEIRRHSELGHECIWELRLRLVLFALQQEKRRSPILSSWTVSDELLFIEAYIMCYGDAVLYPACYERGWYESSGGVVWTSYFASKYGLLLLHELKK